MSKYDGEDAPSIASAHAIVEAMPNKFRGQIALILWKVIDNLRNFCPGRIDKLGGIVCHDEFNPSSVVWNLYGVAAIVLNPQFITILAWSICGSFYLKVVCALIATVQRRISYAGRCGRNGLVRETNVEAYALDVIVEDGGRNNLGGVRGEDVILPRT